MTDHWNDDEPISHARLLASAYLDGELHSGDRARAEADPEVQRELEAMRETRRLLATSDVPDAGRRESAIAAALAAADDPVAPVVPLNARRGARWLAPMAAAAAAIVIVVGGVVALRDGGDDDSGAARRSGDGDEALSLEAQADTLVPAQAAAGTEAAEAPAGGASAATTSVGAAAPETATEATSAGQEEALTVLRTQADLQAFAADQAQRDAADAASEAATCGADPFLGLARYESADGTIVDVEVYAVEDPAELIAVDRATCAIVLRTPNP